MGGVYVVVVVGGGVVCVIGVVMKVVAVVVVGVDVAAAVGAKGIAEESAQDALSCCFTSVCGCVEKFDVIAVLVLSLLLLVLVVVITAVVVGDKGVALVKS